MGLTLYHIHLSHFSEKARWALDLKKLDYRSRGLTPGFHLLTTRRVAGTRTVPILVDDDSGAVLPDSTDILHYLDRICPEPALFPHDATLAAEVARIEDAIDTDWGPNAASFGYAHLVDAPAVLRDRWSIGLGALQRLALRAAMPVLVPGIRRARNLSAETAPGYRNAAMAALRKIEEQLAANGGEFLVGDRFTAADLTAASLLGPYAGIAGSPWDVPVEGIPDAVIEFRAEVAARPAGEYARRIWERHRGR